MHISIVHLCATAFASPPRPRASSKAVEDLPSGFEGICQAVDETGGVINQEISAQLSFEGKCRECRLIGRD